MTRFHTQERFLERESPSSLLWASPSSQDSRRSKFEASRFSIDASNVLNLVESWDLRALIVILAWFEKVSWTCVSMIAQDGCWDAYGLRGCLSCSSSWTSNGIWAPLWGRENLLMVSDPDETSRNARDRDSMRDICVLQWKTRFSSKLGLRISEKINMILLSKFIKPSTKVGKPSCGFLFVIRFLLIFLFWLRSTTNHLNALISVAFKIRYTWPSVKRQWIYMGDVCNTF